MKYSIMSICVVFLAIYLSCCLPAVTSQQPTVFSLNLTAGANQFTYNFNELMFNRFFYCLRNKDFVVCDATTFSDGDVVSTRGCPQLLENSNLENSDGFTCTRTTTVGVIACKRGNSAPQNTYCSVVFTVSLDAQLSQQARMMWVGVEKVETSIDKPGIMISTFPINTLVIKETNNTSQSTVITTERTHTDAAPDSPITTPTTTGSHNADKENRSDDGDDNNMPIIIGAAVGGAVVLAIIVIIVVILWRRKKKTQSSSRTNNKEYEDTDIYPYGDSNLNNITPNLNSNNLNTNPNPKKPVQDSYATVDPNKKLNKTNTSSDTNIVNNNNKNKSQKKKSQFSPNLDYTAEVDIDNDAGHYQSGSGVHSGQGIANRVTISSPAPPDPSAKPSSYNIRPEASQDPSATYSQVVKTNKTKDASVISRGGASSNPTRDLNGHEDSVPRTDTQYTTVMDSSHKNTPYPAPEGVYAKLNDPVRNITDVYNEWPATDKAGE